MMLTWMLPSPACETRDAEAPLRGDSLHQREERWYPLLGTTTS